MMYFQVTAGRKALFNFGGPVATLTTRVSFFRGTIAKLQGPIPLRNCCLDVHTFLNHKNNYVMALFHLNYSGYHALMDVLLVM